MSYRLMVVFQGTPVVEGNGMSSLYKLQVKSSIAKRTISLHGRKRNLCLWLKYV